MEGDGDVSSWLFATPPTRSTGLISRQLSGTLENGRTIVTVVSTTQA
jgi:hypothetical protein